MLFLFTKDLCAQSESRDSSLFNYDSLAGNFNSTEFSTPLLNTETGPDEQDASSLLQSSRDVFTQFSAFQFGAAGYKARGYASGDQMLLINGVKLASPETGFASWSSIAGLNDMTRNTESNFGTTESRLAFSEQGGYINIDSKASTFKKGTRFSYSNSNRLFRHRLMLTRCTGVLPNGWAVAVSVSCSGANEGYRPGTSYKAAAFYLSLEKQIGEAQAISLTAFVAPTEQGRSAPEPLEVYGLSKTNYYNSLWGYQNGKARNSTVGSAIKPMVMLSHVYKMRTAGKITTTVFGLAGKTKLSGLNWYNSSDPRPDYYSYLPSFLYNKGDSAAGDNVADQWINESDRRQINWDRMIAVNQANLFTLPSQIGQGVNTSQTCSRYILEDRVENTVHYGFNVVYNRRYGHLFLSAGINACSYNNRKYKEVNDLLGGSYWLDYDMFAQNAGADPFIKQNNIEQPDKKIYAGDRFGYDYSIIIRQAETWCQLEYSFSHLDVYGAFEISQIKTWREGHMANGKFPENSKGPSENAGFVNRGLKTGATYKLSGRHFLTANAGAFTRAPETGNIFISPATRNELLSGLKNEKIISADLNYFIKFPTFKLRLSGYHTVITDQIWKRTYYSDVYNTNINLLMKNINRLNTGLELGIEKNVFTSHTLQAAVGYAQFIYKNRPTLEAWQDNNSAALFANRTAYLKNYRTSGAPQLVAGVGYKYSAGRKWFAGFSFNYFDRIFIEPNPDRRTEEALSGFFENESEQYSKIIAQQKIPAWYIVNATAGTTLRVSKNHTLNFNLSANNLLNNKNNLLNGREQLRWDAGNIDKFPNKYVYATGTNYMFTLNMNF
ncbi:MAG: hypothetical protein V4635_03040 [Bacteroidota bacterium]